MIYILIAILATIFWSIPVVVDKFLSSDSFSSSHNPKEVTILCFFYLSPVLILIIILYGERLYSREFLVLTFLIGIINTVDFYYYIKALEISEATIVSIFLKSSLVLLLFMEFIILGTRFSLYQYSGIFVVLFGTFISVINHKNIKLKYSKEFFKIIIILWIFYCIRLLLTEITVIREGNPINIYIYSTVFSIFLCLFYYFYYNNKIDLNIKDTKPNWIVFSRTLAGIGGVLYIISLTGLSVTISTTITAIQPLIVLITILIINRIGKNKTYENYSYTEIVLLISSIMVVLFGVYLLK